ncbi:hypothetical protein PUN4_270014 [Paraburkholderia unamae]|nr:hypothetical protein PUN4_270014 [Paraburkholderia unamae]
MRIGDTISLDGIQGQVAQIRRRHAVVRRLDGIEPLIPNEKLISGVSQNHSSYLTRVCGGCAPAPYLVEFSCDGAQLEPSYPDRGRGDRHHGGTLGREPECTEALRSTQNRDCARAA